VGSKVGCVRLYDKAAESRGKAASGTLRWEAEARVGWLRNYGEICKASDVTREKIGNLAMNRWEWSAMGAEVSGEAAVVQRALLSGLSERETATFIGWLAMQRAGRAWSRGRITRWTSFGGCSVSLGLWWLTMRRW
jgi:hypothetical protein